MDLFNGTLLVQIGNFLITYWFLSTFFLKKGYSVVTAQDQDFAELQDRVAVCKQMAHDSVQKKENAWLLYMRELQSEKPDDRSKDIVFMHIADQPPMNSTVDTKKLAAELVPVLESLIKNPQSRGGNV